MFNSILVIIYFNLIKTTKYYKEVVKITNEDHNECVEQINIEIKSNEPVILLKRYYSRIL